MSGRINPREYDLGELRDAVDERARTEEPDGRANGAGRRPAERREREIDRPTEPVGRGTPRGPTDRTGGSVAEDPETYLQARNRGGWGPIPASGADPTPEQQPVRPERRRNRERPEAGDARRGTPRAEGPNGVDIELLSHRSGGNASRPYLETVPGTFGAQREVFEWLEFLVSRAGMDGARSALEYYEAIEWLSAESRAELERFVDGVNATSEAGGSLGVSDHRESLVYVARLASRHD